MKIIISIILISFLCLNVGSQSIDTIFLNSKWEPVKEKRAKYYRIIEKINDTLFQVSEYNFMNVNLMNGKYSSIDPLIENGSFIFLEHNSNKIKAYGKYSDGAMVGDWIYFNQSGDSVIVNYDFQLKDNDDTGYSPDNFIHPTMPIFDGSGDIAVAFRDYIFRNQIYPALPKLRSIEGRVLVQFSISPKGKVSDIKVIESANRDLEREAIRVIANSPDWIPGRYGDKLTTIMFTFPVYFKKDK
jgi:TonB family protein